MHSKATTTKKLLCQPIITQSQLQQHIQDEIYIKSQLYDNGKAIRAHLQHQKLIHLQHHTPPKLKQRFINQLNKLETKILEEHIQESQQLQNNLQEVQQHSLTPRQLMEVCTSKKLDVQKTRRSRNTFNGKY